MILMMMMIILIKEIMMTFAILPGSLSYLIADDNNWSRWRLFGCWWKFWKCDYDDLYVILPDTIVLTNCGSTFAELIWPMQRNIQVVSSFRPYTAQCSDNDDIKQQCQVRWRWQIAMVEDWVTCKNMKSHIMHFFGHMGPEHAKSKGGLDLWEN